MFLRKEKIIIAAVWLRGLNSVLHNHNNVKPKHCSNPLSPLPPNSQTSNFGGWGRGVRLCWRRRVNVRCSPSTIESVSNLKAKKKECKYIIFSNREVNNRGAGSQLKELNVRWVDREQPLFVTNLVECLYSLCLYTS